MVIHHPWGVAVLPWALLSSQLTLQLFGSHHLKRGLDKMLKTWGDSWICFPCHSHVFTATGFLHKVLVLWQYLQLGTADAEIKGKSVEDQELKGSLLKAWSRSKYSYACLIHCQAFLPLNLFLPSSTFTYIFSKTSPGYFLCQLWLTPVHVWAHRIK